MGSVRHEDYYFSDGSVVFLVQDTLFRVHRMFLERDSFVFRDMFSFSSGQSPPQGTSDEDPIVLQDYKSEEFGNLLWIFYNQKYDVYEASEPTWLSILSSADRWDMPRIRSLALSKLQPSLSSSPLEKIHLFRKFDLDPSWAMDAFAQLVCRREPLTTAEARRIGVECAMAVARAREKVVLRRCLEDYQGGFDPFEDVNESDPQGVRYRVQIEAEVRETLLASSALTGSSCLARV